MIPIVDVSRHQGAINFTKMAANHVEGVIIRAGNGVTPDPRYAINCIQARAAGLKIGAYWFCNPRVGTAIQQGLDLAAASDRERCELPPMLDVEDYSQETHRLPPLTPAQFADWLTVMVAAMPHTPIIYSNAAFWNPNVASTAFGHLDIIVARYPFYSPAACAAHVPPVDARDWDEWIMAETTKRPQVPMGWSTWQAWQFSAGFNDRGPTYGATSDDLDLNIVRDDVWERWLSIPPAPAPHPVPDPAPPHPPTTTPQEDDDEMKIFTNSEQFFQCAPGTAAFGLIDFGPGAGKLRTLTQLDWDVRGNPSSGSLSNAQIGALGVVPV